MVSSMRSIGLVAAFGAAMVVGASMAPAQETKLNWVDGVLQPLEDGFPSDALTIIVVDDPRYTTMEVELFGPVLTLYPYDDAKFEETLVLCDQTSPYALTGAIFATDRKVVDRATAALRFAAGNFYVNDKPTGAVVGQQPFGGSRASGTNDKAGSKLNLVRWISARAIKETFAPPTNWRYPFMAAE